MSPQRARSLSGALAVIAVVVILVATLTPNFGSSLPLDASAAWAGHFALFALLGLAAGLAFMTTQLSRLWLLELLLVIAAFAAADELAQQWVEGRAAELADWVADTLGGGVGIVVGASLGWALLPRRAG